MQVDLHELNIIWACLTMGYVIGVMLGLAAGVLGRD